MMSETARIAAAEAPYSDEVAEMLEKIMPSGVEPLVLFKTLARDERLFSRFMGGGLLDKGHLSLREREIAIDRTTARCGSAYEWGVHVAFFADRVGLSPEQIEATVEVPASQGTWSESEWLIVRLMDELHETSTISDVLWLDLRDRFTEMQLLELIMLAGFYHMVAYITNGLRLPLEAFGALFPG
jgi:alkylhydroperoxidase family enzyme